jgi:hypothetical protein
MVRLVFDRAPSVRIFVALVLGVAALSNAGCGALIGLDPGGLEAIDGGSAVDEASSIEPGGGEAARVLDEASAIDSASNDPPVAPLPSSSAMASPPAAAAEPDAATAPPPAPAPAQPDTHKGMATDDASPSCTKNQGMALKGPGEGDGCGS